MFAMGYGECWGCGLIFGFNPKRVPSIIVGDTREPICEGCVEDANPQRIANGLKPIEVHPDAYEAIDEREL